MTVAGGFEPGVVVLSIEIFFVVHFGVAIGGPIGSPTLGGRLLAILCVEIERVCGERLGARAIVNIEIKRVDFFPAFIGYRDVSVFLKRHGKKGVKRFVGGDSEWNGLVKKILAEAETKEIANGRFDAGRGFAVPIHTKDKSLEMEVFRRGDSDPDVCDDARAVDVEQVERGAGGNGACVGVAAGAVVAGYAFLHVVMRPREREERFSVAGTRLRVERRGQEKRAGEKEKLAHSASQR